MTDKQKLKDAEQLLKILKADAKIGLHGGWDNLDEGWQCQIDSINKYFSSTKDQPSSKFKQTKMDI